VTSDDWTTPKEIYETLNDLYGPFGKDPCPIGGKGGLEMEWDKITFVNPPYSNPRPWIEKAIDESRKGKRVVMLLRADTSTKWFHDLIYAREDCDVQFVYGRLKFGGSKNAAPFPSMVVIYDGI
jgi:hypothetical protein